jgi:hypothetical protein
MNKASQHSFIHHPLAMGSAVLGLIFLGHGLRSLLVWWTGYAFSGTTGYFAQAPSPSPVEGLMILAELLLSLGLIAGALYVGMKGNEATKHQGHTEQHSDSGFHPI